jgi:hypothetical protein
MVVKEYKDNTKKKERPNPQSFRISPAILAALDARAEEIARETGVPVTRSAVLRAILEQGIAAGGPRPRCFEKGR